MTDNFDSYFFSSNLTQFVCPGFKGLQCEPPNACARDRHTGKQYCCDYNDVCWTLPETCAGDGSTFNCGSNSNWCCKYNSEVCTESEGQVNICWSSSHDTLTNASKHTLEDTYSSLSSARPSASSWTFDLEKILGVTSTTASSSSSTSVSTTTTTTTGSDSASTRTPTTSPTSSPHAATENPGSITDSAGTRTPTTSHTSSPHAAAENPGSITDSASSKHGSSSGGLSAGAIGGIAVGAIAVVLLLSVGAFLILRKRRQSHQSVSGELPANDMPKISPYLYQPPSQALYTQHTSSSELPASNHYAAQELPAHP